MNNFLSSIDALFEEYNLFVKQKHKNIKFDLNTLYKEFKENNNLTLENDKKKVKTAYQNFFSIMRREFQDKHLPFGEQSKLISNKWKSMSSAEKKKYDTNVLEVKSNSISASNIEEYFITEQNSDSDSEDDCELHLENEKVDENKNEDDENGDGDEDDANQYQDEIESDIDNDENERDELDSVEFNFQD